MAVVLAMTGAGIGAWEPDDVLFVAVARIRKGAQIFQQLLSERLSRHMRPDFVLSLVLATLRNIVPLHTDAPFESAEACVACMKPVHLVLQSLPLASLVECLQAVVPTDAGALLCGRATRLQLTRSFRCPHGALYDARVRGDCVQHCDAGPSKAHDCHKKRGC